MMRLLRGVSRRFRFSALILGGITAASLSGTAEAGHAHFSGSVHFSGGFRGGASVRFARPGFRPGIRSRVWVGGRVWRRGWYYPRPYFYYYYPYPYPYPYEAPTYYPVQPGVTVVAPPGEVVMAAPRRAPLPVFGLGVFGGAISVKNKDDSSEIGLLARLRLSGGLLVEAEIAKDELSGNVGCPSGTSCPGEVDSNGKRIDRRIGGSLIYEIGAHNSLAPYILGGGGVQQAKLSGGDFVGANFDTTQTYAEGGAGLRLALSRSLYLAADVRVGRTWSEDSNGDASVFRSSTITPPSPTASNNTEDYVRGRLAAIVNF